MDKNEFENDKKVNNEIPLIENNQNKVLSKFFQLGMLALYLFALIKQ